MKQALSVRSLLVGVIAFHFAGTAAAQTPVIKVLVVYTEEATDVAELGTLGGGSIDSIEDHANANLAGMRNVLVNSGGFYPFTTDG